MIDRKKDKQSFTNDKRVEGMCGEEGRAEKGRDGQLKLRLKDIYV